jgi:hypothetical protein
MDCEGPSGQSRPIGCQRGYASPAACEIRQEVLAVLSGLASEGALTWWGRLPEEEPELDRGLLPVPDV